MFKAGDVVEAYRRHPDWELEELPKEPITVLCMMHTINDLYVFFARSEKQKASMEDLELLYKDCMDSFPLIGFNDTGHKLPLTVLPAYSFRLVENNNKCTCDIMVLMARGCQCGGS